MFKAIREFFKWKCFICKHKDIDSKYEIWSWYEKISTIRFHKDCIEKVLRHPEKYNPQIVETTLDIVKGMKQDKAHKEDKESQARKLNKEWLLYISE